MKHSILAVFAFHITAAYQDAAHVASPKMEALKKIAKVIFISKIADVKNSSHYPIELPFSLHDTEQYSPENIKLAKKTCAAMAQDILNVEMMRMKPEYYSSERIILDAYKKLAWLLWRGSEGVIEKDKESAFILMKRAVERERLIADPYAYSFIPQPLLMLSMMLFDDVTRTEESYDYFKKCIKKFPHVGFIIKAMMYCFQDKNLKKDWSTEKYAHFMEYMLSIGPVFESDDIQDMYNFLKKMFLASPEDLQTLILTTIAEIPCSSEYGMMVCGNQDLLNFLPRLMSVIESYRENVDNVNLKNIDSE